MKLKFTSLQSENTEAFFISVADYLSRKLSIEIEYLGKRDWKAREADLYAGQIDLGVVCGLQYLLYQQSLLKPCVLVAPTIETNAATRPLYLSCLMVRANSSFRCWDDLRGAVCAFNEPTSYSGYQVVIQALFDRGLNKGFFKEFVETGSHQNSLRYLLQYRADVAAIDKVVAETEFQRHPEIRDSFRILTLLGPSTAPPLVASSEISPELRGKIVSILSNMHREPEGVSILEKSVYKKFLPVYDHDYDEMKKASDRLIHLLTKR